MLSNRLAFEDALKPICALCRKEVERMQVIRDPRSLKRLDTSIIIVWCHGKRRECRIENKYLYRTILHRGIAFIDELSRKLPTPEFDSAIKQIEHQFKIEDKKYL